MKEVLENVTNTGHIEDKRGTGGSDPQVTGLCEQGSGTWGGDISKWRKTATNHIRQKVADRHCSP